VIFGLAPSRFKTVALRTFGATIWIEVICNPRLSIKYPWLLEIGDHVWLGELVWIAYHCGVKIGSDVCISQDAYIFTGNHDWNDPTFAFACKPVEIGGGVWVTAFQKIGPGTTVPSRTAIV